ncbi:DNA replication licensing factor MCM2 [Spironucleus salmonicida]|uniref:DNA helicase n=1 Tax=Spironucleus salmonicida TaxID=348837 RepID=V6LKF8_9EUKA|nr:DNA replication licensing factor MCM2 [Spironucleus salmonicida]|eukprot:EST45052.1 DNA replication licensing factor MCM2 [Spironucleus salmonicida]
MSDSSTNSEPSSATELDDINLVMRDNMELQDQSEISTDLSAEKEAFENPLLPAQIRAAERALAARDGLEQPEYKRRISDNENITERLKTLGFESESEVVSEQNFLPVLDYNLAAVKPVSEEIFKQHLIDFVKNPTSTSKPHIKTKFIYFLKTFRTEFSEPTYIYQLKQQFQRGKKSLTINLAHLREESTLFVTEIISHPKKFIEVLQEGLNQFINEIERHADEFQLKLVNPLHIVNSFSTNDVNKIATIHTQIISQSRLFIQLESVSIQCLSCNTIMGLFEVNAVPKKCDCGSTRLRLYPKGCLYSSYVNIVMQMENGEKRSGIIYGDLITDLKPGMTVDLTGIWEIQDIQNNICKINFRVYGAITNNNEESFNAEDITAFQALLSRYKSTDLDNLIISSIFPSIYGHELLKQMILISLLSGTPSAGTRENIHLLIIGDPGTAKSQFLKYLKNYTQNYTFSSGKSSSAAGLTVSVVKRGGEFTLQAGQMVLSNNGICCIDELDKMTEIDRVAMHQAMEQQEVSIAKAGIIATLPAKCSVIAACNPVGQVYNRNLPLNSNLNVGDALLSRFDLVYIVTDDHENDKRIGQFILNRRALSSEQAIYARKMLQNKENLTNEQIQIYEYELQKLGNQEGLPETLDCAQVTAQLLVKRQPLPQSFIKKYIMHARLVQPQITEIVAAKLRDFYVKIRQITHRYGSPVTARQFGCLLRITEAHAKLHFRKMCTMDDADFSCQLFVRQLVGQLKGAHQRRAEVELLQLVRRGGDVVAGILGKCFQALEIYNQNSSVKESKVSAKYLMGECQNSGIELNSEFLNSVSFLGAYKANYDSNGVLIDIEKKQLEG